MDDIRDDRMKAIDAQEDLIIDALGPAGALDAITRALDYDTKADIYAYIIRVYDLAPDTDADTDTDDTGTETGTDTDTAGTGRKEE